MIRRNPWLPALVVAAVLAAVVVAYRSEAASAATGPLDLESVGALTFAPDGTLFLADSYAGVVHAVELGETGATGAAHDLEVRDLDQRVASLLGVPAERVLVHDLAVSPVSGDAYLTASRGAADDGTRIKVAYHAGRTPHLLRLSADGELREALLDGVRHSTARLRDVRGAGENRWGQDRRAWNVLELAFHDGELFVSGVSNEEWSAKIRRLAYPFEDSVDSTAIRIFHTAHGQWETGAPARVFAPYEDADGDAHLFAGFSCTPLVTFDVDEMRREDRVVGRTIAELGAGNHVLDMLAVEHGGRTSFLLANHLHPFMRLDLEDFQGAAELTRPTNGAGIDRQPLGRERRVVRLAALGDDRVLLLRENGREGGLDLETAKLADLLTAG